MRLIGGSYFHSQMLKRYCSSAPQMLCHYPNRVTNITAVVNSSHACCGFEIAARLKRIFFGNKSASALSMDRKVVENKHTDENNLSESLCF